MSMLFPPSYFSPLSLKLSFLGVIPIFSFTTSEVLCLEPRSHPTLIGALVIGALILALPLVLPRLSLCQHKFETIVLVLALVLSLVVLRLFLSTQNRSTCTCSYSCFSWLL